jgi:hypothetical protein
MFSRPGADAAAEVRSRYSAPGIWYLVVVFPDDQAPKFFQDSRKFAAKSLLFCFACANFQASLLLKNQRLSA